MGKTIGCIGCGNMGGALLAGFCAAFKDGSYAFCGYNRTPQRMDGLREAGVKVLPDPSAVARTADIIILAVKPYQVRDILSEIQDQLSNDKIVLSVAAGIGMKALRTGVGDKCPVVRCMPNTPALVGKGVFALCFDNVLSSSQKNEISTLFGKLGICIELQERQFPAFSALVGAGPAYVFSMMQGLVQAGVTLGFTHNDSRRMVDALFAGCAAMAENDTSLHLLQLRDAVCSPGGLTIAGVNYLDRSGMTGILVDAVLAAAARGREMER